MEKKELKMYEVPAIEVVELETQGIICGSDNDTADDYPWGGWGW